MRHRFALVSGILLGALGLTAVGIHQSTISTTTSTPEPSKSSVLMPAAAAAERRYPRVPADNSATAELLARVETALRDPSTAPEQLPELGHQQQVIYRVLSKQPTRSAAVVAALPQRWRSVAQRHLAARREFLSMARKRGPSTLPAWRIIQPEPAQQLLSYYRKAETATGIAWEVLAAVNLVETGMGRIDGVSVANAQGPMQFLPTTWAQAGVGEGDIRDPHDAIQAAARYLVRRGGSQDIRKGLWGYNNSDYYGRAVMLYASLMEEDPRAYTGLYHWEIHYNSAVGDLWLPVGYAQQRSIPVQDYLKQHPESRPPQ